MSRRKIYLLGSTISFCAVISVTSICCARGLYAGTVSYKIKYVLRPRRSRGAIQEKTERTSSYTIEIRMMSCHIIIKDVFFFNFEGLTHRCAWSFPAGGVIY